MRIALLTGLVLVSFGTVVRAAERSGTVQTNPFVADAASPQVNRYATPEFSTSPPHAASVLRQLPADPVRALGAMIKVASTKNAYPAGGKAMQVSATPTPAAPASVTESGEKRRYDPAVSQAAWVSDDSMPARSSRTATVVAPQSMSSEPRRFFAEEAAPLAGSSSANPLRSIGPTQPAAEKDGSNPLR